MGIISQNRTHAQSNKAAPQLRRIQPQSTHFDSQISTTATNSIPTIQLTSACACGGGCPRCKNSHNLQTKLQFNQPGDKYEREANLIAQRFMRMPVPQNTEQVLEQPINDSTTAMFGGRGRQLPGSVRTYFEPRFGYDFGHVRVHTGAEVDETAHQLNARAFTIGRDIAFGDGQYNPHTSVGKNLLGHELTHVVQQTGGLSPLINHRSMPRIARAPLDLRRLDLELFWTDPLTQNRGEIGFGATRGTRMGTPSEDSNLPITTFVFPRNTTNSPLPTRVPSSSSQGPGGTSPPPTTRTVPRSEAPSASPRQVLGPANRSRWALSPSGLLVPARRALVISGIHGNERGPLDIGRQLQTELSRGTSPLARDFDVIFIPIMNPGGVADRTRGNRRGVDLNRNFPGLSGFPAPRRGARIPPRQPEVQAVMNVVNILNPSRILALHAVSSATSAGVYSDPVEGDVARDLACRMALRMRGTPLPSGVRPGDVNVRGNEVANNVCNTRYPSSAQVSVTTQQSSLGAWASAPSNIGGGGGIPTITHEVGGKSALAATGRGRSVATIMPGIRDFLLDNERSPSEADALLRSAVTNAFLRGQGTTSVERNMLGAIRRIVNSRFQDMDAFYRSVWRPRQSHSVQNRLPLRLNIVSHARGFQQQSGIARRALARQALFRVANTDQEITQAILSVMQTISLPGFSRHHWGTEVDVVSATRSDWVGSGRFVPLIPFLRNEARRFGFFHPYSGQRPNSTLPHYQNEPWHLSHWVIANVLQQEWATRISGQVLNNLIAQTARAVHGPINVARMEQILRAIGLQHFHTNVAPSP